MSKPRRYLLISLLTVLAIAIAWYSLRSATPQIPEAIKRGYSEALEQARNGKPGAARVLYQQLARPDISDKRRLWLHAELPNYPSPQALKLADADLHHPSVAVRQAAIHSIVGLVPSGQRSLLLGPLLEDDEQAVRFSAAEALLGLSPDDLGLYFGPLQQVIDEYGADILRLWVAQSDYTADLRIGKEILKGVAAGDRIVIDGTGKLRPGVKVADAAPAAPPKQDASAADGKG